MLEICPLIISMILSQFMVLFFRWAIVIIVQLQNFSLIKLWIVCSVLISILDVASSMIMILLFRIIDLQMQMSCFSPQLKFCPFSKISWPSPCGSRDISPVKLAWLASSWICSSLHELVGSMLNLRVSLKITGSWGITVPLNYLPLKLFTF